ncbi:SAF domain-containing protein [Salana multivorans]|nr:SAF domain-containing protein [Salana multivorans]
MDTPTPDRAAAARRRSRGMRSLWWRYRPLLVGGLTFWLVLAALPLARPSTATVPVVVATRDLAAGTVLAPGDVTLWELPRGHAPPSALAGTGDAVGHQLRHAVAAGVAVVPLALADGGWGLAHDESAVPVRLADPLVAALLEAGDRVELVRADGEATASLTADARILAIVDDVAGGGLLGSGTPGSPLLLVAVPEGRATLVLDASARGTLTAALAPAHL